MKRILFITSVFVVSMTMASQATIIAQLNFDGTPVANGVVYTPGPGDITTSVTMIQSQPWPTGVTQPTFTSYTLVTPTAPGLQGGNVMEVNKDASTQRQGIYMLLTNPITGDWTAECIFQMYTLNAPNAEYKIQDIMQAWFLNGGNSWFEVRFFGDQNGISLPPNALNLTDSSAAGSGQEHQTSSASNLITANQWCHVAVVYTSGDNTMSLYLNGGATPIAQVTPGFQNGTPRLANILLGAWANDAGSDRDLDGAIDAFALSDTALTPGTFVLPIAPAEVKDWTLMQ